MRGTIAAALNSAQSRLESAGISDPSRDARRLLAFVLDVPASHLTFEMPKMMPRAQFEAFEAAISARMTNKPVSQITGRRLFFDLEFIVTPEVLDPRPETEILLAAALENPFLRCLDLGTGSGCILLSLLAASPYATGVGVDISKSALSVAKANATALDLSERAEFQTSNWLTSVNGTFDLIVSNPPYISGPEFAELAPDVADHEPKIALTPGPEGLEAYRAIADGILENLAPGGRLLVEIGPTQAKKVIEIFEKSGLRHLSTRNDLDARPRCLIFQSDPANA